MTATTTHLGRMRPPNGEREKWFRDAFNAYRATDAPESQRWPKVAEAIQTLHPKK